jgi:hypothetical protein
MRTANEQLQDLIECEFGYHASHPASKSLVAKISGYYASKGYMQKLMNIFIFLCLLTITFFNLMVLAGQHSRIRNLERVLEVISIERLK